MMLMFFKIGFISFGGGWAIVGIIKDEVVNAGFLTLEQFNEAVSVAQMTPGPVSVNVATYVGYSSYGLLGAIMNTVCLVMPSVIIFNIVLLILKKIKVDRKKLLSALKMGTVLMLTYTLIGLTNTVINRAEYMTFIISGISFLLFMFTKIDPIFVILGSAFLGAFVFA